MRFKLRNIVKSFDRNNLSLCHIIFSYSRFCFFLNYVILPQFTLYLFTFEFKKLYRVLSFIFSLLPSRNISSIIQPFVLSSYFINDFGDFCKSYVNRQIFAFNHYMGLSIARKHSQFFCYLFCSNLFIEPAVRNLVYVVYITL